jgi:dTDP-glucose 4,6-dehydratase
VYNAGPPEPISIRDLVEKIANTMHMPFEKLCEVTGDRLGQDGQYWLDSGAIHRDVGWQPATTLEEGLKEMVEWGQRYLDVLRTVPMTYILRV